MKQRYPFPLRLDDRTFARLQRNQRKSGSSLNRLISDAVREFLDRAERSPRRAPETKGAR